MQDGLSIMYKHVVARALILVVTAVAVAVGSLASARMVHGVCCLHAFVGPSLHMGLWLEGTYTMRFELTDPQRGGILGL